MRDRGHYRHLAARDHFGVKPLYFMETGGGLAFASELGPFADLEGRPHTLPPSHYLTSEGLGRYYRFPGRRPLAGFRGRPSRLRHLLEDAVATWVPPEGPVGVLLSGGLDSSAIAALAARRRPDLVAYTVVAGGAPDEGPAAEVAAHLGIAHEVVRAGADEVRRVLPEVIGRLENYDPIMVRNAIPLYLVARRARERVKVLLGGDGADELFAGYDYLERLPRRAWPAELEGGLNELHRTELQRADRMTMAHGVELRVPFLDIPLAEAVVDLPLEEKVRLRRGRRIVKWALRRAVEDLLPASICWREKIPFAAGSGMEGAGAGGDGERGAGDLYRELFRARFPRVSDDVPIWSDAGKYRGSRERLGEPLLGLFR